jgi:hypothetical protein
VLHLDRAGSVTGIDDADTTWRAVVDGMAALAPTGNDPATRERAARVRAIVAALAAQPEAARHKMLASLVTPLIAPELVALMQDRRVTIRKARAFVEPVASHCAKPIKMRLDMIVKFSGKMNLQEVDQRMVGTKEIQPRRIRRNGVRRLLRGCRHRILLLVLPTG